LITFFVDEFLSSHDDITSTELSILEKEVYNAVRLKNIDDQLSSRKRSEGNDNEQSASGRTDVNNPDRKVSFLLFLFLFSLASFL
jgi:hypothetical protein